MKEISLLISIIALISTLITKNYISKKTFNLSTSTEKIKSYKCYISGCSCEICSDQKDVISVYL